MRKRKYRYIHILSSKPSATTAQNSCGVLLSGVFSTFIPNNPAIMVRGEARNARKVSIFMTSFCEAERRESLVARSSVADVL